MCDRRVSAPVEVPVPTVQNWFVEFRDHQDD
jgi:hypothetical protein